MEEREETSSGSAPWSRVPPDNSNLHNTSNLSPRNTQTINANISSGRNSSDSWSLDALSWFLSWSCISSVCAVKNFQQDSRLRGSSLVPERSVFGAGGRFSIQKAKIRHEGRTSSTDWTATFLSLVSKDVDISSMLIRSVPQGWDLP